MCLGIFSPCLGLTTKFGSKQLNATLFSRFWPNYFCAIFDTFWAVLGAFKNTNTNTTVFLPLNQCFAGFILQVVFYYYKFLVVSEARWVMSAHFVILWYPRFGLILYSSKGCKFCPHSHLSAPYPFQGFSSISFDLKTPPEAPQQSRFSVGFVKWFTQVIIIRS